MKTVEATGEYAVSFNTRFSDYEVGDSDMDSIDYAGDDIDALAAEVIADDPSFPLVFERVVDHPHVVGVFRDTSWEGEAPIEAIMVKYSSM